MAQAKKLVSLTKEQFNTLVTNGTLTVGDITIEFNENDIYLTPQPSYYEQVDGVVMPSEAGTLATQEWATENVSSNVSLPDLLAAENNVIYLPETGAIEFDDGMAVTDYRHGKIEYNNAGDPSSYAFPTDEYGELTFATREWVNANSGSMKLVTVSFIDVITSEGININGEIVFYSSKEFNNITDVYNFFDSYNNGIVYIPMPVRLLFEVGTDGTNQIEQDILMTINDCFIIGDTEYSVSSFENLSNGSIFISYTAI